MITYKVSDLFKRSKQLADLEGSDFISWNEAVNCINESFIGLYEKLINMGDNSFVASFRTKETVEKLPADFWQLKGVYLWNNGNLQTINRRADNNGIHHLSYELRNGELHLFGNPNDVLVEYFPKPKTLLMPPSDKQVTLNVPEGSNVIDCNKHTFLYESIDESENETLSIIDLDGIKTTKDFLQIAHDDVVRAYLTDNYVFVVTVTEMIIYDIMTGLSVTLDETGTDYTPLVTESGREFIVDDNGVIKSFHVEDGAITTNDIKTVADIGGEFIVCNDALDDFFYVLAGELYHNDTGIDGSDTPLHLIYADKRCFCLGKTGFYSVDENNEINVINNSTGLNVGFIGIDERTGYGYCTKKFGSYYVCPYCEDTVLDFPNSFYYQMLSYLLAISFRSKQGADISLLSAQLDMISQTFEDTLGSDAYQFPRMGNVYN